MKLLSRNQSRKRRHRRVRGKVTGTAAKPRLCVFKSLRFIYAQAIDDENNQVLAQANDKEVKEDKPSAASAVGKLVAERCLAKGIKQVVFDRGGYAYHGKVKALADAAREAGLKF